VDATECYYVQVRLPQGFMHIYIYIYVGEFGLGYDVLVEVRSGTACRWMTDGVTT
jgi:hypothetical protein